jgi:hypothetical protein
MTSLRVWIARHIATATTKTVTRRRQLMLDQLEDRNLLSAAVEPIGGTGNNVSNPAWGSAGTDLLRISPVAYADGISTPSLPSDPSARVVSNILNSRVQSPQHRRFARRSGGPIFESRITGL